MKTRFSQFAKKSGSPRIDNKRRLAILLVPEMAKFDGEIPFPAGSMESHPTNSLVARLMVGRSSAEPPAAFIHFSKTRPQSRQPPWRRNREKAPNESRFAAHRPANGSRCNAATS